MYIAVYRWSREVHLWLTGAKTSRVLQGLLACCVLGFNVLRCSLCVMCALHVADDGMRYFDVYGVVCCGVAWCGVVPHVVL